MTTKALVVLSGGQDSSTCLFWALQNFDEVSALTFNYGQRHQLELSAARKIAKLAGVPHEVIDIPDILHSTSPLTSQAELERYTDISQMNAIIENRRELTFVPMRNALFLTIAANRAEEKGIKNLVTGVCQMDAANYDDCRKTFVHAAEQYINTALGHDHRRTGWILIHTPLMDLSKAESIELAADLPGAWKGLEYSHTCYDGKYPPCGTCHSCVLRADGFANAKMPDPLILRAVKEKKMPLPETKNYSGFQLTLNF